MFYWRLHGEIKVKSINLAPVTVDNSGGFSRQQKHILHRCRQHIFRTYAEGFSSIFSE